VNSDADGTPRLAFNGEGAASSRDYDVVSTRPNQPSGPVGGDDLTDPRWLQLPAGLPQRVKALSAQLVGGAPTRAAAVSAVNDYLHSNEKYNLTAPVPAAGVDAVDSFLFDSHQGFCEQFATAAVVLLRASGIPSRLITGYSQGDLTSEPGKRVMRGSDAHAWVQVWYPGVGWVDDDPTANAVLSDAGTAASAKPSESASPSPSASPSASVSPEAARPASGHRGQSLPGGRLGLAALLVGALALAQLMVAIRRRRARARPKGSPAPRGAAGGPVLQAYLRLDAALTAAGSGRAPDETPRELAGRLAALSVTAGPTADLTTAVDLLERECYAVEPLASAQTVAAVDVFDELTKSVKSLVVSAGPK
jgi:transglutaminase-like putative cysteine protease